MDRAGRRIIIVEPDVTRGMAVQEYVEDLGYVAALFSCADEALKFINDLGCEWILLSDQKVDPLSFTTDLRTEGWTGEMIVETRDAEQFSSRDLERLQIRNILVKSSDFFEIESALSFSSE